MTTVNIEDFQSDLQHLLDQVAAGESLLITRAGKPLVKVEAVSSNSPSTTPRLLGFAEGMYPVPQDIKGPFREEIEAMFGLED